MVWVFFFFSSFHAYWWQNVVVTLPLCNRTNLGALAPNRASLAFASLSLKHSFHGKVKKGWMVRWYAIKMVQLVQIPEFSALLLAVQSLARHVSSLHMLCKAVQLSYCFQPPRSGLVCLFSLFSCCILSWFFLRWSDFLCSSWLCVSLLLITHLLSSSACWYAHSIASWWLLKIIANIFQKIQLDNIFFLYFTASILLHKPT